MPPRAHATGPQRGRARALVLAGVAWGLSVLGSTQAAADDPQPPTYRLVQRRDAGLRTSADSTSELHLELAFQSPGAGVFQRERRDVKSAAITHEWLAETHADGSPKRIVRTYERAQAVLHKETSPAYGSPTQDRQPLPDPRHRAIVTLACEPGGARRLVASLPELQDPALRAAIEGAAETDLLPREPVAVGATWQVPAERIAPMIPGAKQPAAKLDVSLARVERLADGREAAVLAFRGEVTLEQVVVANPAGEPLIRASGRVEVTGEARFDLARGVWIERTLRGSGTWSEVFVGMHEATGPVRFEERTAFRAGLLIDAAPPLAAPPAGPASVDAPELSRGGRVADDHLVIVRRPDAGPRISVFDPKARRVVRDLVVLPKSLGLDDAALAPSRSKLAFSSTWNNAISLATWNVFVLDLDSGEVDQVTPGFASGRGLAKPITAAGVGTITGRVTWRDSRGVTRSDVMGGVHLDGSPSKAIVGAGGAFTISGVPATSFLVRVRGSVSDPAYGNVQVEGHAVVVVPPGGVASAGTIVLHNPPVDIVYGLSAFVGSERLVGRLDGTNRIFDLTHPARALRDDIAAPGLLDYDGFAVSPDGRRFAVHTGDRTAVYDRDTGAVERTIGSPVLLEPAEMAMVAGVPLPIASSITGGTRGAWLPDSTAIVHAGYLATPSIVPALLYVRVDGQVAVLKAWPEWARALPPYDEIRDVAIDAAGEVAYFVRMSPVGDGTRAVGEVYAWEAKTDITTRLSGLGDIAELATGGR